MKSEERPIVFTITRSDKNHFRIWSNDNRVDFQACVGRDIYPMLSGITKQYNDEGYAVLFEVD